MDTINSMDALGIKGYSWRPEDAKRADKRADKRSDEGV
jgi:hypothetical protein